MHSLPFPVIQSKLHRPPLAADVVARPHLYPSASGEQPPLCTLICAAAGYGKSTVACQWLASIETPSAWFSIDESDDDLRQFVSNMLAAVLNVQPDTCRSTVDLLNAPSPPPPAQLAQSFCIDFEQTGSDLVFVFEDYHRITSIEIHNFLNALLRRPPSGFHSVIVTRRDPPLALQSMRANGMLRELRSQDLAFNARDAETFLKRASSDSVSAAATAALCERTEGWPAAMRLALLAVSHGQSADSLIERIPTDIYSIRSYLMHEVLNGCSAIERELLMKTSFLNRFCALLCRELRESLHGDDSDSVDAVERFMSRIQGAGLFSVPLDTREEWYRYHHLFQSMLQDQARIELGEHEITAIHLRAAAWFERHGLIEEALRHLLQVGRADEAASLIVRNRNQIMNAEQWIRLMSMLRSLPDEVLQSRPDLMLLRARLLTTRGGWEESSMLLAAAEPLLEETDLEPRLARELEGSLESLRCYQLYAESRGRDAVRSAARALELLPPENETERGFAMILLGGAMQMTGDPEGARSTLYQAMPAALSEKPTFTSRLLTGLGFVNWIDADLSGLVPVAKRAIEITAEHGLREIFTIASSLMASAEYHRNQLEAVVARLEPIVDSEAIFNAEFHAQCMILCALAHQERGRPERASGLAANLEDLALRSGATYPVLLSRAFNAELALRQGRITEAGRWAASYDAERLAPNYSFLAPPLVLAKVLIASATSKNRDRAADVLDRLIDYTASIRNKHCLAEALALRSLLEEQDGDRDAARRDIAEALSIAQPGRYIRLFVDLGPGVKALLTALDLSEDSLTYVGEILAGFGAGRETPALSSTAAEKPLSKRELQILDLLARRLSNKEIADSLCISDVTVKRHTANIYQKLGVHGRRHAVAKATGLGLLDKAPNPALRGSPKSAKQL